MRIYFIPDSALSLIRLFGWGEKCPKPFTYKQVKSSTRCSLYYQLRASVGNLMAKRPLGSELKEIVYGR